jgi:acetyl-CoA synthetase
LSVPKAFVTLRAGVEPSREMAAELFAFTRARLAPYLRIRRIEFRELPKTISGKIRRVELRREEAGRAADAAAAGAAGERTEYREEDVAT